MYNSCKVFVFFNNKYFMHVQTVNHFVLIELWKWESLG